MTESLVRDENFSDIQLEDIDEEAMRRRDRAAKVARKLEETFDSDLSREKSKREQKFPLLSVVADHLEPFILHIAFATVFYGLCRCLDILFPVYIAISIDTLRGRPPGWVLLIIQSEKETSYIVAFLTCSLVALYLMQNSLGYLHNLVFTYLSQGLKHSIRMELFDKMQVREIGLMFGLKDHKQQMLQLLIHDCEQLEKLLVKGLKELSQLGASLTVGVISMLYLNWKMTIIALSPCLFLLFLSPFYWYKVEKLLLSAKYPESVLNERIHNIIDNGITEMKTHDMQISEYNRVATSSRSLQTLMKSTLIRKGTFVPVTNFLMLVGHAGIVAVGSFWLLTNSDNSENLTIGYYTFFLLIIPMIVVPFSRIGQTIQLYRRSIVSIARMLNFLRAMPTVGNPNEPLAIDKSEEVGIHFENVYFSYPTYDVYSYLPTTQGNHINALNDVSFSVEPQSTVAITGPSGSGKSAIAKLLVRLYDTDKGTIRFGDVDIKQANLFELHKAITLVTRQPYIIAGSIAENINYGSVDSLHRPEVIAQVKNIASIALLDPLLQSMPRGIHTILTENAPELTIGQRQLINIARALRQETPIIVLYGITDLLDIETEELILKNFDTIFSGKTVIIVSSKLSLVRQADHIIILDKGSIEEQGEHSELLEADEYYAKLWNIYTGGAGSKYSDIYPEGDIRNFKKKF